MMVERPEKLLAAGQSPVRARQCASALPRRGAERGHATAVAAMEEVTEVETEAATATPSSSARAEIRNGVETCGIDL